MTDVDNEDRADLAFRSTLSKEQKELNGVHLDYIIPSSEKLSYPWLVEKDISECSRLKLTRSRSCEESITGLISPWCESEEKNSNIPVWHKRDITESPGSIQRKFCAFKYRFRSEMSRNSSQNSSKSHAGNELKARNVTTPNEKKFADHAVSVCFLLSSTVNIWLKTRFRS